MTMFAFSGSLGAAHSVYHRRDVRVPCPCPLLRLADSGLSGGDSADRLALSSRLWLSRVLRGRRTNQIDLLF